MQQMQFGSTMPRALDLVAGGWRVAAILQMQSGNPFTPSMGPDPLRVGSEYGRRPNANGSGKLANPTRFQWFDTSAFSVPAAGMFGTAGRNILRGPGYSNWDASVLKDFHYTERTYAQFRFEAFNTFNHPHLGQPNTSITSGGVIRSAQGSRQLQGAIKIYF
jgi:hypothetical protein